mgnify:FL=1
MSMKKYEEWNANHKHDNPPREKIVKLGRKITDVAGHIFGGVKVEDPEYWGLAEIVSDEMADIALAMKKRTPYTFKELCEMSTAIFHALGQLIVNFASTIKQMSGPVGIYKVTSQVRESGSMTTLLYLVAMLSVNIGILNLLPIPGLDGYQAILSLIEGIIHREVPVKVKYALQVLGLVLVFGLMIAFKI